jgi:hypothetical protein
MGAGYWLASGPTVADPTTGALTYDGIGNEFGFPASCPAGAPAIQTDLAGPVVGVASASDGFWLAGADGGVYADCGAPFFGSMGGSHLAKPIVGIAATPDGGGYWLVVSDGGVFAFGDAGFGGSMAGTALHPPMVGIADNPAGNGYWTVATDGGVFAFGDAPFLGSAADQPLDAPFLGIASTC